MAGKTAWRSSLVAAALLVLPGCIDPLVEDDVPPRDVLFDFDPSSSVVQTPREYAASSRRLEGVDPGLAERIAEYDGVSEEAVVYRLSGFAGGNRIWYWNFGAAPDLVAPIWVLVHPFADGERPTFVDHPPIWDVVPGDTAYSPFWRVNLVVVTGSYHGERLLSRRGVDEAIALGLVQEPISTDLYFNCPVVGEDVRMQVRSGSFPGWDEEPCPDQDEGSCLAPHWAYYRGLRVAYFDTNGARTFDPWEPLGEGDRFELRRETEALALSEAVRRVDITGDGDDVDTNDVFAATPCDGDYTPIHRTTEVFVAADYRSIDTARDETEADARQVSDLFTSAGEPRAGVVRGVQPTDRVENIAIENLDECP